MSNEEKITIYEKMCDNYETIISNNNKMIDMLKEMLSIKDKQIEFLKGKEEKKCEN